MQTTLDLRKFEAVARSPRARKPRSSRRSLVGAGIEALERREVLTVAPSSIFVLQDALTSPSYPAVQDVTAVIGEVPGTHTIRAVFTYHPMSANAGPVTVSLADYKNALPDPVYYGNQERIHVVSYTFRNGAGTATLEVEEAPTGCTQADAYVGPSDLAPLRFTPETNEALNRKIVASEITCAPFCPGTEGQSPCYWANNLCDWSSTSLKPDLTLGQVFQGVTSSSPYASLRDVTLEASLSFKGGPTLANKAESLLGEAVAGLLNTTSPDIHYPISAAKVLSLVDAALQSQNTSKIDALASTLRGYNNLGGGRNSESCREQGDDRSDNDRNNGQPCQSGNDNQNNGRNGQSGNTNRNNEQSCQSGNTNRNNRQNRQSDNDDNRNNGPSCQSNNNNRNNGQNRQFSVNNNRNNGPSCQSDDNDN